MCACDDGIRARERGGGEEKEGRHRRHGCVGVWKRNGKKRGRAWTAMRGVDRRRDGNRDGEGEMGFVALKGLESMLAEAGRWAFMRYILRACMLRGEVMVDEVCFRLVAEGR